MAAFSSVVSAGALGVVVSTQSPTMDIGQGALFVANVTGGNGNYTCQWMWGSLVFGGSSSFGSSSCSAVLQGNSTTFVHQPDNVAVSVNDSVGDSGSGTAIVAVYRALNLTVTPSATSIYPLNSITLNGVAGGGRPPYT